MSAPPRRAVRPATGDPCGQGRPRSPPSTGRPPRLQRQIRVVTDSHSGPPLGPPLDGWGLPAGKRIPRATSTHCRRRGCDDYVEPEDSRVPLGSVTSCRAHELCRSIACPLPCLVVNQPHGRQGLFRWTRGAALSWPCASGPQQADPQVLQYVRGCHLRKPRPLAVLHSG